jgi:hypothetical protein
MYLEAVIEQVWWLYLYECRGSLGSCDGAIIQMHLEAMTERD